MLTVERQQKILKIIQEQNIVKLQELTQLLDASESTIRRDLQELEDQQLLERIHGGAKKVQHFVLEPDMNQKTKAHLVEKQKIAQYAATLLQPDDVCYLDAGTTTLAMIPYLHAELRLKVVTNSVQHAAQLIERNIQTIILGGSIKLSTHATLGQAALQQLRPFHFTKAFIGANGIDLSAGITTPDPEEAILKQIACQQAQRAFILADASKFQKVTFTKFADLAAVEIITDSLQDAKRQAYLAETTITEVSR